MHDDVHDTVTAHDTDDRDVARARERFLSRDDNPDAMVRRMIHASWIRSRESKVDFDRISVPYVRDPDLEAPLCRSAAPILDTLGAQLQGESISIILTDHAGLVLDRRCSRSDIAAQLDGVRLAPGFSYAEEFAGTNGIGTAVSSGGVTLVDGQEHYSHELGLFACAGAPIKHPTRGKTVGILDLTTWSRAPGPMLTALACATARQIEEELLAQTGLREFALFQEYMKVCQHSSGPVLALNNDVVMSNDHVRQLFDPAEQDALIGYAMDTMRAGDRTTARTVELPSGRTYVARRCNAKPAPPEACSGSGSRTADQRPRAQEPYCRLENMHPSNFPGWWARLRVGRGPRIRSTPATGPGTGSPSRANRASASSLCCGRFTGATIPRSDSGSPSRRIRVASKTGSPFWPRTSPCRTRSSSSPTPTASTKTTRQRLPAC
jgi:hypothetical protein